MTHAVAASSRALGRERNSPHLRHFLWRQLIPALGARGLDDAGKGLDVVATALLGRRE